MFIGKWSTNLYCLYLKLANAQGSELRHAIWLRHGLSNLAQAQAGNLAQATPAFFILDLYLTSNSSQILPVCAGNKQYYSILFLWEVES